MTDDDIQVEFFLSGVLYSCSVSELKEEFCIYIYISIYHTGSLTVIKAAVGHHPPHLPADIFYSSIHKQMFDLSLSLFFVMSPYSTSNDQI